MKIQSRPPEKTTPTMTVDQIAEFARETLVIEGNREGSMYRKVLTLGMMSMLRQQGVITDYQVQIEHCGMFDIMVHVVTPDRTYHAIAL